MTTQNTTNPPESSARYWRRVLRPLFWWLLLVLVLFGIRTHQRLMEKTRLNFTVTLGGGQISLLDQASTTFDGKPLFSGEKIPLGNHQFIVTHPKGETYTANLFIWYGAHDLGTIDLKRTMGTLVVTADPPADWLLIRGPEWSVLLTNSAGLTQSVPTDAYAVEVRYPHWQKNYSVGVFANQTAACPIVPHFGGLKLDCNQTDATFQLLGPDGLFAAGGNLPATVSGLPAGNYKILAAHHGHERTDTLTVKADRTNTSQLGFEYGAVVFETAPAQVSITSDDGRNWGETPRILSELLPGNWKFTLQRLGYQSVQVSLDVAANETNMVSTNLISETYFHAMTVTRQSMANADYDHALQSANDALAAKPDDAEAITLQREATGLGLIKHATTLGQQGDYLGGHKKLTQALQFLPDNAEAQQLIANFKQHEPEQIERLRVERLALPKKTFDALMASMGDTFSFESHELTTSKSAAETQLAIELELKTGQPGFQILRSDMTGEIFRIEASQDFLGGSRRCEIVGGQSKNDETQIYFKVVEMKKAAFYNQPIGSMWGALPTKYTLIDPNQSPLDEKQKKQIADGVSNLMGRIQMALGQTPPVTMQPPAVPQ
jgi:hypothetical protein